MSGEIENYAPGSGRVMREDSSIVNMADIVLPSSGGDGAKALADTTAALLAADQACKMVIIQNATASAGILKVGLSNAPKIELYPGQMLQLAVTNLNKVYVQAVSTATANYTWQA